MSRHTACLAMLDRQLQQLEMDRALLKREVMDKIDQEFDKLRTLTLTIKTEIESSAQSSPSDSNNRSHIDGSKTMTGAQVDTGNDNDHITLPSSSKSTGQKRKFTGTEEVVPKQPRVDNSRFACIYPGCGKSFPSDSKLATHERTHTEVRPFSCTWRDCHFDAAVRGAVVAHIRIVHFKLPRNQKYQRALNITDQRDPKRWIRVNRRLLMRRLTEADFGVHQENSISNQKSKSKSRKVYPSVRKRFICKSPACNFSTDTDSQLAEHERSIHLDGIRPFHCTWTGCDLTAVKFGNAIRHVRSVHFGLPQTVKLQRQLNIEDQRDPKQYVRVVQELIDRRL